MPSVAISAADWKLNENLGVAEPRYELLDVQLKSAHPWGSKLHPPAYSPDLGEEDQEFFKIPLPPWKRDLG